MHLLRYAIPFGLAALAGTAGAQTAPHWLTGDDSSLSFIAIQQGAAFEGSFENFTVEIQFAPGQLETSRLLVTVDLASVDTQYADRDEVLRAPEFFDVMRWPRGRFEAQNFRSLGEDMYEAIGQLMIRDQSHPLVVPFTFSRTDTSANLTGEVVVPRLRYGIGLGDWADTSVIGGDVTVRFNLHLLR